MAKFTEDLYNAQGEYVKTVEWAEIPSEGEYVQVMHAPSWPIDPEYARKYDAWMARQTEAGRPTH